MMGSQALVDKMDCPERSADRRGAERATALFRPALLERNGFNSFCLVRNISSTGMMATVIAPPSKNSKISVRFDESTMLSGKVAWQEGDKLGIKFDAAIEVQSLLEKLGKRKVSGKGYRSPRLPIEVQGQFLTQGETYGIQVMDLSQRGLKATVDTPTFVEGKIGTIVLSGFRPRQAVVRWTHDYKAGFYFLDPISFSELGQWVLDYYERVIPRPSGSIEAAQISG